MSVSRPMSIPTCGSPGPDDVLARSLLQRAQGATQKWPEGFRGFRARVRCRALGREAVGVVTVQPLATSRRSSPRPSSDR